MGDGSEPHGLPDSGILTRAASVQPCRVPGGCREGVPGVGLGGYREGAIPGTKPGSIFEAYLMIF